MPFVIGSGDGGGGMTADFHRDFLARFRPAPEAVGLVALQHHVLGEDRTQERAAASRLGFSAGWRRNANGAGENDKTDWAKISKKVHRKEKAGNNGRQPASVIYDNCPFILPRKCSESLTIARLQSGNMLVC